MDKGHTEGRAQSKSKAGLYCVVHLSTYESRMECRSKDVCRMVRLVLCLHTQDIGIHANVLTYTCTCMHTCAGGRQGRGIEAAFVAEGHKGLLHSTCGTKQECACMHGLK